MHRAKSQREYRVSYVNSEVGAVPWQLDMISFVVADQIGDKFYKYHEDVRLLLQGLSTGGLDVPTSFRDCIALVVCDQINQKCIDGTCENCPGIQKLAPSESNGTVLEWQQWSVELGKI